MDGRAMAVLAGLALAAFALRLLRIGWAYGLAWKLRQAATTDLPEAVSVLARRCEARMGLMNLDVRISARVAGPVTIGIVRPAVLLPEGLLERQGEEVTEAALAHEMAHVRRRDGTRKLVEELMLALIAWHPLARWLSAQLDHTRELACDEDAARAIEGPRQYSRSLVAIAMEVAARPVTAPGLCSMGEGSLRQRVERLLAGARRPPGWRLAAGALALVAAMSAAAFAVVVPASREDVGPRDTGQQKVLEVEALGQEAVRLTTPPPPPPPPPPKPPAGTRSRP
jgi:D-alanyl-D-alanine endopeptidase (penicillin-binding protein 7)